MPGLVKRIKRLPPKRCRGSSPRSTYHVGGRRQPAISRLVTSGDLVKPYRVPWHCMFPDHGFRPLPLPLPGI